MSEEDIDQLANEAVAAMRRYVAALVEKALATANPPKN